MNVFELRDKLVNDYSGYVRSFIQIRDTAIRNLVEGELSRGLLWPDPLIQLNPAFEPGDSVEELVQAGVLHERCQEVFRLKKRESGGDGVPFRLHRHQAEAVRVARGGGNYVLTTGTGSGKSLSYIIPIVDHVLRNGSGRGIQAIVVYPMNALANSQYGELSKFLQDGYPDRRGPVKFERYTGQETEEQRNRIIEQPPDILLTNFVMLELILTRVKEQALIRAARGLRFLVLDELHTYRGRQGADVAMLVRRVREFMHADRMQCVGTSATLAAPGTLQEQQAEVARVASSLFGGQVRPENIIGETLSRSSPSVDAESADFLRSLGATLTHPDCAPPADPTTFLHHPLSIWIESTFGVVREPSTQRLIRAVPKPLGGPNGAARLLSQATGVDDNTCADRIRNWLLAGLSVKTTEGKPIFAFRVHQFIGRGDTVYSSFEPEEQRFVTVKGQQFVPGDRSRVLLPLVFCRQCGQEYYCVWRGQDDAGDFTFTPRRLEERRPADEDSEPGFLYLSSQSPWPTDKDEIETRVPSDWLEEHRGKLRLKPSHEKYLPQPVRVGKDGKESADGAECVFVPAPFRLCLQFECGVAYSARRDSDVGKLGSLGTGGRSTATTVLSISAIRGMKGVAGLSPKLLSFTDNRQDAALQAGHLNDFVEVTVLRGALYKAVTSGGTAGLRQEELPQKVFDALALPFDSYASNIQARFQAEIETRRAMCDVLAYRLYLDLQRGWRLTSPNLEQCGLLVIDYESLIDVCQAEDVWARSHAALVSSTPQTREKVARALLDYMRRELAIKVECLDESGQIRIRERSRQRLAGRWAIDEDEQLENARLLLPRSRRLNDDRAFTYVSPYGDFGRFLRRHNTFENHGGGRLSLAETQQIINDLLNGLRIGGIVERVREPRDADEVPAYQLQAGCMIWKQGDGKAPPLDPLRVADPSAGGGQTNRFFIDFYRHVAQHIRAVEAREHTAQVPSEERLEREDRFRDGRLPILFCSPTMELGVDIAELNTVNMRNVPPTPANYAQRSGRAGRSGQPALVFTYCTTGSPHDQYFYQQPERMVAGSVAPPRLDLTNEDLIRAHVHAIWLAEASLSLGSSLQELIDCAGEPPSLKLKENIVDALQDSGVRARAAARARRIVASIEADLTTTDWYTGDWLTTVLDTVPQRFEQSCERWRTLYEAAFQQSVIQGRIARDPTRQAERTRATQIRNEAEIQLRLLTNERSGTRGESFSDFYSYRYFASEGFLPGYNFPRLPLSAFIPGRRTTKGDEDFLSRPRFLAISEFGPRAFVYHEGSRYIIEKAIIPAGSRSATDQTLVTSAIKSCQSCGYIYPIVDGPGPDLCQNCNARLDHAMRSLFRLQNVSTRRRDRINCDEEERTRLGYELRTGFHFAEREGRVSCATAILRANGRDVAQIRYGHTATIWRINAGENRRANRDQLGFVLDIERGTWASDAQDTGAAQPDGAGPRTQRVIPYVEDRRNCLTITPVNPASDAAMASLQAAIKSAVQIEYQLEDSELSAEPLPTRDDRNSILLYEASEGGAGVLRQLVEDPRAVAAVARQALALCHFDPVTGRDLEKGPRAKETCTAACYDCLMSYGNQMDHRLLDRHSIKEFLTDMAMASVETSPTEATRGEHMDRLVRLTASELERRWLRFIDTNRFTLPSSAQVLIESCGTRPDFAYKEAMAVIYVDGPPHEFADRQARDIAQTSRLEDEGYQVIRFKDTEDWNQIAARHPDVFGRPA